MVHHPHNSISIHISRNNNSSSHTISHHRTTRLIRRHHRTTTKGPIRPLNTHRPTRTTIRPTLLTSSGRKLRPTLVAGLRQVWVDRVPRAVREAAATIRLAAEVAEEEVVPEVITTTTICPEASQLHPIHREAITEVVAVDLGVVAAAARLTAGKIRTTIHPSSPISVSSLISSSPSIAAAEAATTAGITPIITPATETAVLTASTTNTAVPAAPPAATPIKIRGHPTEHHRRETATPPTSI